MHILGIYGRAGTGVRKSTEILCKSIPGMCVQGQSTLSIARSQNAVAGYIKMDKTPILSVEYPETVDFLVIFDKNLSKDALKLAGDNTIVIVNSREKISLKKGRKCHFVDADSISVMSRQAMYAIMIGGLAKINPQLSIKGIKKIIETDYPNDKTLLSMIDEGYKQVK